MVVSLYYLLRSSQEGAAGRLYIMPTHKILSFQVTSHEFIISWSQQGHRIQLRPISCVILRLGNEIKVPAKSKNTGLGVLAEGLG